MGLMVGVGCEVGFGLTDGCRVDGRVGGGVKKCDEAEDPVSGGFTSVLAIFPMQSNQVERCRRQEACRQVETGVTGGTGGRCRDADATIDPETLFGLGKCATSGIGVVFAGKTRKGTTGAKRVSQNAECRGYATKEGLYRRCKRRLASREGRKRFQSNISDREGL